MTGDRSSWAIALVAAVITTTLVGGIAMAGVQPLAAQDQATLSEPVAGLVERDQPKDKIKAALDALVAKGTITHAQEDAILQALKESAPAPRPKAPAGPLTPNIKSFIGDMMRTTTTYLGLSEKDLMVQLRAGKSVADVTTSLNKSTAELTTLLAKNANDRIDQAVTAKKLTAEQAATLKSKVAAEISSFLKRSFTKPAPRPQVPLKPTPSPKP